MTTESANADVAGGDKIASVVRVFIALLTLTAIGAELNETFADSESVGNFFSFFTIQSNLFAAAMLLLTAGFVFTGRDTERLAYFRGASSLYMVITGIVYFLLLRGVDVQTDGAWVNTVVHYVMPVVMLLDWILFPPGSGVDLRKARVWLLYPATYAVYSLVRGGMVDWYPYPFIDLRDNSVISVVIWIAVLLAVTYLLIMVFVWLGNRRRLT